MKTLLKTDEFSWIELDLPQEIAETNDYISKHLSRSYKGATDVWNLSKDKFNEIKVACITKEPTIKYYNSYIGDVPKKMLRKDIKQVVKNLYCLEEFERMCSLYMEKARNLELKELVK